MTEAKKLIESNKRPSLPVSIPIHVYHNILKKESKQTFCHKVINMSTKESSTEQKNKKETGIMSGAPEVIINTEPEKHVPKIQIPETSAPETSAENKIVCDRSCCNRPHYMNSSEYMVVYNGQKLLDSIASFLFRAKSVNADKGTQTDNLITLDDIEKTRSDSGDVLKDIASYSNQVKQFFGQLYTICQVLIKEKTSGNTQTLVYSQRKRQQFLTIVKSVVEAITSDVTDTSQLDIDVVDVDEQDRIVNKTPKKYENTVVPEPREAVRQDDERNQRQKASVNSVEIAPRGNAVIMKEEIAVTEQTVTNTVVQRDVSKPAVQNPRIIQETVNQNISDTLMNTDINIDQNTFIPQMMDNTRRFCNTPLSQAMQQQQQFYQHLNYLNCNNKMFRHPSRGNARHTPYSQLTMPMRSTERPQYMNSPQSSQMYYTHNQPIAQQQYKDYYKRKPEARQNNFPFQY